MKTINTKETTKELVKNTGIIAIGQVSTKIINFFLLPLYTNILSTSEYGLVDLLTTYTSLLTVLVGLQINAGLFRFLVTNRDFKGTLTTICTTSLCFELVCCIVYMTIFLIVSPWITIGNKWFLVAHVIAIILLNFFSGFCRGLGYNKIYALANFLSAFTTLICNVITIAWMRLGPEAMLASYIIGPMIGICILFFKGGFKNYFDIKHCSRSWILDLLKYSVPLVPNELSWSLLHSSDRMIITNALGMAANGIIAVASKFSKIYTTLFSIFNASWTEQVVLHYKDQGGKEYIGKMFDEMLCFFGGIAIFIILCMPFAYKMMVPNPDYANAYNLVPIYIVAVFFNAVIGLISAIYAVENETKKAALTTVVAALVNIIIDIILVKRIGVYAAPVSSLCGYLVISIWRLIDVNNRYCKIYLGKKSTVMLFAALAIAFCAYWTKMPIFRIICTLASLILLILLNAAFIRRGFAFVKSQLQNILGG